jgi:hypothetical protein
VVVILGLSLEGNNILRPFEKRVLRRIITLSDSVVK